jgi:spermidine synthase
VRVFRSIDAKTEKSIVALTTSPLSVQSAMFTDSDELVLNYTRFYHLLRHFKPDFENTLMIGGAGYSFPKEFLRKYPNKKIDVVEIDPGMTQIARDYFRLEDNPNLRIFHEDGRIFLNQAADKRQYDAILLDAFGSVYSVPYQLTTREAIQKMHGSLTDDGVVILNLISAIESGGSLFLQAEYKTFAEVFQHVYLFKIESEKPDNIAQNLILVASKSGKLSLERNDPEISALLQKRYEKPLNLTAPILTDDLAPVEYYSSLAQKTAKTE